MKRCTPRSELEGDFGRRSGREETGARRRRALSRRWLSKTLLALLLVGAITGLALDSRAATKEVKVSVVTLAESEVPTELVSSVERRLLLGLKDRGGLEVRSLDSLLGEFSDRPSGIGAEQARQIVDEAEQSIRQTKGAWLRVKQLKNAVSVLEKNLSVVSKKDLAWAQFLLARALMSVRQWRSARTVLVRLFGWRMSFKTPRHLCRSRCLELVLRARKRARNLPAGELRVESSPKKAKVYLDGRYQGLTPTLMTTSEGRHYVTVRKPGYLKRVVAVDVGAEKRETVELELPKSSEALILEQSLPKIRQSAGKTRASSAIRQLRSFLLLDQVVLVKFEPMGGTRYRTQCFLYDLRTGLLLNKLEQRVSADDVAPAAKWAALLYSGVRLDGSLPDPGPEPRRSGEDESTDRALYEQWWFWTALAVGVASVAVPLSWGLATRQSGAPAVPKGYRPVTFGF